MRKIQFIIIGFCLISTMVVAQNEVEKTQLSGNVFVTRGLFFDNPTLVQETEVSQGSYCLVTYMEDSTGKRYNFPTILDFSIYEKSKARTQRKELLQQYNIILPNEKIPKQ